MADEVVTPLFLRPKGFMPNRRPFALLLLLAACSESALGGEFASGTASPREACAVLAREDPVATDRCLTHVRHFEPSPALIEGCAKFHPSVDVRFRCLKSGADVEILRLCAETTWALPTKLACLQAYPSKSTLERCQRAGGSEEIQVECLRTGL